MSTQIDTAPSDEQVDIASQMLKLVSDPTRFRILWALLHGEHSVNELAEHVGAQGPAVSQHLAKLREANLVKSRKDGNKIFYVTDNAHVHKLIEQALSHAEHVTGDLRHGE